MATTTCSGVIWFVYSGVILTDLNRVLTIQRVKKEDSGLYTCTACNKQGCDFTQAQLTVEGKVPKASIL